MDIQMLKKYWLRKDFLSVLAQATFSYSIMCLDDNMHMKIYANEIMHKELL